MLKKEIRKEFLEKRKNLSASERLKLDDMLLIQFQRIFLEDAQILFNYFPVENMAEHNTFLMADYLKFRFPNLEICYPKTNLKTHEMQAVLADEDTEFEINAYGLSEPDSEFIVAPEDIDVVFVPLLSFDSGGFRVGYGKGYYDKFLSLCREDVLKIGFSYFESIDEIEDKNEWDIPLNYCITPLSIYHFE